LKDKDSMKNSLPFIIIAAVLVVAFAVGMYFYNSSNTPPVTNKSNTPTRRAEPGSNPPRLRGNPNAKVVIEEFGDFQCPPCALLHPDLKKLEAEYGDKLAVVFRNNPLPMHKHAYDAARAAEAAGLQGRFFEMHDLLYENQKAWESAPDPRADFVNYARQLGLNVGQFQSDMVGPIVNSRVALDLRRGESLGVTGTPTLFLNGRRLDNNEMTADALRKAINDAYNQANK
jgi:protein-disulfide isomerase